MREKREDGSAEGEVREWERSSERKSYKLVERGAAIQRASAPLTCSGLSCDLDLETKVTVKFA
jgi:hypothetical protein